MAIYEQPVRVLLREMVDELAPKQGDVFTRQQAMDWFARHYPKVRNATVAAHLLRFSANAPSRVHYNTRADEDLLFQIDRSHFRRYDPATDPAPIRTTRDTATVPDEADEDEEAFVPSGEFAYESDLRRFLAKNPSIIEPGLELYQDEGITGVEFPAGGRFIDLLCVDAQQGLVVIELKVSRGYDRVVGQLLRYMAWVRKHHADAGQQVRGMIIAREISDDLRLACSTTPQVELFEYELSVALHRISL